MVGKRVQMTNTKDKGKYATILKEIKPDVFRVELDNGARTVVHRVEFVVRKFE
jgi:hypothetical protein